MKQPKGFTLAEMMVAVTIFATACVIVADLFLAFNRTQRSAEATQSIQGDTRSMMASLIDRIRSGEIDYAAYAPSALQPETELHLIGEDGTNYVIRQSDSDFGNTSCPSAASTPCLEISGDGGTTFSSMTSDRVRVIGVQFYIDPPESPLAESSPGVYTYNVQPHVTFSIGLQGATSDAAAQGTTFLQTTVSSRVLLR